MKQCSLCGEELKTDLSGHVCDPLRVYALEEDLMQDDINESVQIGDGTQFDLNSSQHPDTMYVRVDAQGYAMLRPEIEQMIEEIYIKLCVGDDKDE